MTAFYRSSLLMIFPVILLCFALSASAQDRQVAAPSAAMLAAELHSGDAFRISEALRYLPYYEDVHEDYSLMADVHPLVARGIISALEDQIIPFENQNAGEDAEYLFEAILVPLITYAAQLPGRDAIPVLLRASQFSGTAVAKLASFGPDIIPVILDYMNSSELTRHQLKGGFYVLAYTVRQ